MALESGTTILHYRIERQIGEGGMGVVYAAEDTRLGRRIALKVLPAEMAGDATRRARFEREARAVAALNHPNIVTLHSVEEAEGVCFLTMEYVDGQRLSHLLERQGLPLAKLLDWSLAIAEALVAAHRQGVVHRDLKPDNVMVTADGRIKVLDFGLAKLRESTAERSSTALATASITEEGKILGTVAYMSPEQAEGKPLDHRSDVFSFGVVLYELATGRRPFHGDTAISTISSILKDTPVPLQQVNDALPPQLGKIVRRCLAKEPEHRYQSTEDLRHDLRELKEDSESGELTRERSAVISAPLRPRARTGLPKRAAALGAVAGLVVLAALVAWLWPRPASGPAPAAASLPSSFQMVRATTDGKVDEAAISPDGRYVAYVRRDGSQFSLRLRQLATGDEVQVVAPSEVALTSPAFSADGDFLYYVSVEPDRPNGWARRVSVLGGTPRDIVDEARRISAAPDGHRLAIDAGRFDQTRLRIVGSDGQAPRDVARREGRDHFDSAAKWSPDGLSLAILSHRFGEAQQVVLIDPETGQEQTLRVPSLRSFSDVAWTPGGHSLYVAGSERPANQGASAQIWEVSTDGVLQPVTRDLNSYSNLSVTADGATVAAVQEERRSGIEVATVHDGVPGQFTELFPISASRAGLNGIAWLPGGRLLHGMLQGDASQVFVTDVESKASRALSSGALHDSPVASRDGRTIVVLRADGTRNNLWRLDPETGREQSLTDGQFDVGQVVAPDGAWVVYTSFGESIRLLKVPASGGTPVEVVQGVALCTDVSADGQQVLCFVEGEGGESLVESIPLAGGEPRRIAGIPSRSTIRFGPDGRSITYMTTREGVDELWAIPAEGGDPRRLARFEGKEILDFAWSPDGTRLALVKGSRSGDVVLLKRAPRA